MARQHRLGGSASQRPAVKRGTTKSRKHAASFVQADFSAKARAAIGKSIGVPSLPGAGQLLLPTPLLPPIALRYFTPHRALALRARHRRTFRRPGFFFLAYSSFGALRPPRFVGYDLEYVKEGR
jgi:hypothetical protein